MIKNNPSTKSVVKTILIILAYAALLLASEIIYRHFFSFPALDKAGEAFALTALFLTLFVTAKWRILKYLIAVFFLLAMLANNVHYAVYHSWITGMNYYLMFAEASEAIHAGNSMLAQIWPHALWAIFETAFFSSILLWKKSDNKYPISDGVFIILIAFIIIRSFTTVHGQGISPDSGYSRLKAHYFSFGYFIGRILPYQWFDLSKVPTYSQAEPEKNTPKIRNIILIMGESAAATHFQHFGYPRETSPFLNQLSKQQPQTIIRPVFSAGKMTFVSLPLFFNAIPRPNGFKQINQGTTNLFRLAQQQGFQTIFHTAQPETEMELMNLIGSKWIDEITYPTALGRDKETGMNDFLLLPYLQKTSLNEGNKLIVLHQRGSHMPYGHYLSGEEKVFKSGSRLDEYDNTIHHTDSFIQKVFEYLQQQPQKDWLLIYTSDHGQYVTDSIANQGTNDADSFNVPLLIYTPDSQLQQQAQEIFNSCPQRFHQQVSEFMIYSLGYNLKTPENCVSGTVTNNSLTGDIGWLEIDEQGHSREVFPK